MIKKYSPDKMSSYNYKSKKKKAIKMLKNYKNQDGTQKESSIEAKVRFILDELNLYYQQEYPLYGKIPNLKKEIYRVYDFYVTDGINYKFVIECHGDYFHYYENQVKDKPLSKGTKLQRKNVRNDKNKERLAKSKGIPLLVLWESEIKTNLEQVKNKILEMINYLPSP